MVSRNVCRNTVAHPAGESTWHGHLDTPEDSVFLRGLINGMRCGILAIDRECRVVMINDLGHEILGLASKGAVGMPVDRALEKHPALVQMLRESFSLSHLPARAELDLGSPGAQGTTIGFTLSMIPGASVDEPAGAAIFFKDLTQIEHKEEQERLRDRLAALGQMAANLAHEIRNPLAAIEVSCALLKRKGLGEGQCELVDKVMREVQRLNRTVTSSLEFVRPMQLSLQHAEISAVIDAAIMVARQRCAESEAHILRSIDPGIPPFLMDRGQLRQVFENLLVNAVQAVGRRGIVRVEAEIVAAPGAATVPYNPAGGGHGDPWLNCERFVVVRVADSGPGIPAEEREKVFYPFFTTKNQGSGVGLSVVKKIVDSHRGLIDVDTATEGGALFTVRLPMVPRQAED